MFSIFLVAPPKPNTTSTSLEFWGPAATRAIVTVQQNTAACEGHRIVMDAFSRATTFGDAVEACKVDAGRVRRS